MIRLNHYNSVQLVHSNKLLVKTNAELDRFVYSTSHDLRAPLVSILGLIDIANRNVDKDDIRQYLGMMKGRIISLDKFIRDITDYSRNNRIEVIKEKIGLADLAYEVWETLRHSPDAEEINFQIEIPNDAEIESDKNRLRIVLTNLIANSIRYHDHRKETKYIRLRYQINGRAFYIKVEDNGQGIHPDYQEKVFDMFYRASEKSNGTGLGLYIVKETMDKLAGSIHLDSAPGVGTTFVVKIPY
jgi:signal transduction histidine kinase